MVPGAPERGVAKPARESSCVFSKLVEAEAFENFLQHRTCQKRFSPGGGESLIPLLDAVLK